MSGTNALPLFGETDAAPNAFGGDTEPLDGPAAPAASAAAVLPSAPGGSGPILSAAWVLLELLARLRLGAAARPDALKLACRHEISRFEAAALRGGATPEDVLAARYALCTALDEQVLLTPWGDASDWANGSLLATFHNETWGGEKVFALTDRVLARAPPQRDLAALLFHLLSLGFQGRFRLRRDGTAEVEALRERLFAASRHGQAEPAALARAPAPRGVRRRLVSYVPVWAAMAVCALLALGVFAGFEALLHRQGDALALRLDAIQPDGR